VAELALLRGTTLDSFESFENDTLFLGRQRLGEFRPAIQPIIKRVSVNAYRRARNGDRNSVSNVADELSSVGAFKRPNRPADFLLRRSALAYIVSPVLWTLSF
jgi:hypothetical protein